MDEEILIFFMMCGAQ